MYKRPAYKPTSIVRTSVTEGETIELMVERALNNKEPIEARTTPIFDDSETAKHGREAYDIRLDKWDLAIDGMEKVSQIRTAEKEEQAKVIEFKKKFDAEEKARAQATNPGEGDQSK